eukprot:scaffold67417_cov34-Tisochrysis_lutea.AAC.1
MRPGIDCIPERTLIWMHMKRNGIWRNLGLSSFPMSKKPMPTMIAFTTAVTNSVRSDFRSRSRRVS